MAISIFPSTAAEFVSNNFVVDMNDTTNNTADTGGVKQAGPYSISLSSGDSSFDVYFVDEDGNLVGYSNTTSIVASGLFSTVVILGVAQDEVISFLYQGSVNNADGEGDEPGAGAYLESISPTDLPTIDDTATVTGGNFGADTEIKFESGATVLDAKNITVNNSTELIVTRPDNLDADLDPWTVRAITTGVPEPTGSNANLLVDEVTAGAIPAWVTTSPLTSGTVNVSYTETLEATDAEGDVTYSITAGSLPTGLSLDSSTGVISGTPTSAGSTFTAGATDEGGNTTTREFTIPLQAATGGTVTEDGGYFYHTFTSTDDFIANVEIPGAEYLIVAGGGGACRTSFGGGAGGAGGLLNGTATITIGTITATIGAGGTGKAGSGDTITSGSDSSLGGIATATGGGHGAEFSNPGADGGSGGGGSSGGGGVSLGGSGTVGQGNDGGDSPDFGNYGGGGGAGQAGETAIDNSSAGDGGDGLQFSDFATATSTGADGGYYAGGGGASNSGGNFPAGAFGLGGGGSQSRAAIANTGGGSGSTSQANLSLLAGASGIVIVRY